MRVWLAVPCLCLPVRCRCVVIGVSLCYHPSCPRKCPYPLFSEDGEKRGVENLTNDTPPKKGFGPPLAGHVFHPPQVSVLCFSCTKIHNRVDQKLFWRGPKIFGRARSLVRFPPPIRFAPPHITAQCLLVPSLNLPGIRLNIGDTL